MSRKVLLIIIITGLLFWACTNNSPLSENINKKNSEDTFSGNDLETEFLSVDRVRVTVSESNILELLVSDNTGISDLLYERADDGDWVLELPPEVTAFYPFNGNADDESGNGNNGILFGSPDLSSDRFLDPAQAYTFDGFDDYIDIGNDPMLKPYFPMTVSGWIHVRERTEYRHDNFFTNDFVLNNTYGITLQRTGDGYAAIGYGNGNGVSSTSRKTKKGTTYLEYNTWYHIVGIFRSTTEMDIYINGEYEIGEYSGFASNLAYSGYGHANIGRKDMSTNYEPTYFKGKIDDIVFFNRELTEEEILILYYMRFKAPEELIVLN